MAARYHKNTCFKVSKFKYLLSVRIVHGKIFKKISNVNLESKHGDVAKMGLVNALDFENFLHARLDLCYRPLESVKG